MFFSTAAEGHAGMQLDRFVLVSGVRGHGQMQHHLVSAPVRFFGDFAGVGLVRQNGNGQRISKPEQGVGLRAVVPKVVDHNRKFAGRPPARIAQPPLLAAA